MRTLKIEVDDSGQSVNLRFIGSIDEDAMLSEIKFAKGKELVIDVSEVDTINSCGSREWVRWMKQIDGTSKLKFVNCGTVFLDYANMLDGFVPRNSTIESFKLPYFCESCNNVTARIYETRNVQANVGDIPETVACPDCGKQAELDVVVPAFFKFLKRAG